MTLVSPQDAAQELLARRQARAHLLDFIRYVWWMPGPFIVGRHTAAICAAIDIAIGRYLQGASSYLDIAVPFRHGKSDIVSRALPAFFLGTCAERQPDVIMSGYGAELVEAFSRDTKRIIQCDAYRRLFPSLRLARGSNNLASWAVAGSAGRVTVAGLGGALTGKGGELLILDDYCKTRAEAVSDRYRDRTWESFRSDFLTRRAPASIVIVCATPWHVDDIRGRIRREERQNPDFPRFEQLRFPARNDDGTYLFSDRFTDAWYREQYATLGKLAAGLLDCSPILEGGNRFDTTKIRIHDSLNDFPQARYVRAWDLASSKRERDKYDPDWTVGEKGAMTFENKVPHLWIVDAVHIQAEAPRRDALIQTTARADGPGVPQYIEAFGGYKDACAVLKQILAGISVVLPSRLPGDKSAKLAPLEPIFDAGNVHLLRAPWNEPFIRHFTEFPDGAHDDFCLIAGTMITCRRGNIPIESVTKADKVLTRSGWQRVLWSGETAITNRLRTLTFSDGSTLTGTPRHRIWDQSLACWKALDSIAINSTVLTTREISNGIVNTVRTCIRVDTNLSVPCAGKNSYPASNARRESPVFVLTNAVLPIAIGQGQPVYNLVVDCSPEFFANGILVHNCDPAAIIYHIHAGQGSGFL